ncbi:DUF3737 family protein [Secundilactobacillus folii]|uniref:DUF3737 family protein n=1 Tax=Secundilactobacillus folii TaxID=2678357 RepID=A0A7X3C3G6_9LACO|nr:DUF3737 family protein [Secundilactobacillus folii]MTV82274.1 DUF3737 family protein [Secundilactobacillus folii]
MKEINQQVFEGERAQFKAHDLHFQNCTFQNGESPLKHSHDVTVDHNIFKWKYPLWYSDNVQVTNSTLKNGAHAGIWYTKHLTMDNVMIEDTKTFRHISDSKLSNITISNAGETLWWCQNVKLDHITATGDYFGKNCENITVDHLKLSGNYAFDGSKNIEVHNSTFETHDAFWNCENVTVYDSTLIGEYLAWNTKHIRFVNCWIESDQGLCYVDDLQMENCSLINTDLAFEYCSNINAQIVTKIDSVKNPISGVISAPAIGELIQDDPEIDKAACQINVRKATA